MYNDLGLDVVLFIVSCCYLYDIDILLCCVMVLYRHRIYMTEIYGNSSQSDFNCLLHVSTVMVIHYTKCYGLQFKVKEFLSFHDLVDFQDYLTLIGSIVVSGHRYNSLIPFLTRPLTKHTRRLSVCTSSFINRG